MRRRTRNEKVSGNRDRRMNVLSETRMHHRPSPWLVIECVSSETSSSDAKSAASSSDSRICALRVQLDSFSVGGAGQSRRRDGINRVKGRPGKEITQ